jgi:uncharacterized lipoprotein YddW (UPF0748 family)
MNRLSTAVAIILALFSLHHAATSQAPPKREFRAAWVASVTNLDWPSSAARGANAQVQKDELTSLLDKLKAIGISAIVFQIRPECDALYNSPYDPWSYWLTGVQGTPPNPYYDPLEFAVAETHKRGMEIHAWFNPYRAERSVGNYPTAASHVTKLHPDWVIQIGTFKFLDPGLPLVREYDARVIADVVRRYDVDGIHMDDYFYPYPPSNITYQDTGTFSRYPRGYSNLADWRRDNVNLLLRMIRDSVQAIKPFVKFGMSPFGIWRHFYPPSVAGSTLSAYDDIYCDAIAWLQDRSIDYLTPQIYWAIGSGLTDYSKIQPWWADSVAANGRHFYPGMAPYRISSWTAAEVPNQITLNRNNPKVGGEVYFRANNGITDNLKGFADSLKQNYYHYPALHPTMSWKDVVPPYPPRAIRYAPLAGTSVSAIQWDLPNPAPDGDSASRYAVYRFDHRPTGAELDDARNLVSIEGQRYSIPARPPVAGPAYFVVTALDRNYNESDTSNILVITPPPAPLLASPVDGATSVPESVVVAWRPVAGITSYHLQVSSDPTFASGIIWNDSTITDTAKVIKGMSGLATYSWRVRSGNVAGLGSFSAPFAFTTGFPRTPITVYPPPATADVPTHPTFIWNPAPAATSYRFQLATLPDYSVIARDTSGITDTTVTLSGLDFYRVYHWRVRATNAVGSSPWSSSSNFRTYTSVEISQQEGVPSEFELSQNYPNPFNPTTSIQFALPASQHVTLRVYDILGREQAMLIDGQFPAGRYVATWNASSAASGTYFYRLTAGSFALTKRMLLLK